MWRRVVIQNTILLVALCSVSSSYSCGQGLPSASTAELLYLEPILRKLFVDDDFSFTLFGNKPMSFTGIPCSEPHDSLGEVLSKESRTRSYRLFEDWVLSLPTEHYHFILNREQDAVMVYLLNKRCFLKVVQDNIDLFKKELGPDVTPEGLLNSFQHDSRSVFEILKYREGLLGILLGYGRHNAMLFQRREDLIGPLSGYRGEVAPPSYHLMRQPKEVTAHQQELEGIEEHLRSFSEDMEDPVLMPIRLPGFGADHDDEETKALEKEYKKVLPKILEAYSGQSLVQAIQEQMHKASN